MKKTRWIMINDEIKYHDGRYVTRKTIHYKGHIIPEGFSWNGVTGWRTSENMIYPSMLHDYLLSEGYTRKYADHMFLRAMESEGVFYLKRKTFYRIVRLNSIIKNN